MAIWEPDWDSRCAGWLGLKLGGFSGGYGGGGWRSSGWMAAGRNRAS